MEKEYKLLKDLPGIPSGTIMPPKQWADVCPDSWLMDPEWFVVVEKEPFTTDKEGNKLKINDLISYDQRGTITRIAHVDEPYSGTKIEPEKVFEFWGIPNPWENLVENAVQIPKFPAFVTPKAGSTYWVIGIGVRGIMFLNNDMDKNLKETNLCFNQLTESKTACNFLNEVILKMKLRQAKKEEIDV